MKKQRFPEKPLEQLRQLQGESFADKEKWMKLLERLCITNSRHQRFATEGALLGSALRQGLSDDLTIVSDDAGQFDLLSHALCRVHTERLIHKMLPLNETTGRKLRR